MMPIKVPCSAGKQQKPLHETGEGSPVPLVILDVHAACGMGSNTDLTETTPHHVTPHSTQHRLD